MVKMPSTTEITRPTQGAGPVWVVLSPRGPTCQLCRPGLSAAPFAGREHPGEQAAPCARSSPLPRVARARHGEVEAHPQRLSPDIRAELGRELYGDPPGRTLPEWRERKGLLERWEGEKRAV